MDERRVGRQRFGGFQVFQRAFGVGVIGLEGRAHEVGIHEGGIFFDGRVQVFERVGGGVQRQFHARQPDVRGTEVRVQLEGAVVGVLRIRIFFLKSVGLADEVPRVR